MASLDLLCGGTKEPLYTTTGCYMYTIEIFFLTMLTDISTPRAFKLRAVRRLSVDTYPRSRLEPGEESARTVRK